jgi:AbrB family looped-hinge helix DNA binding protein
MREFIVNLSTKGQVTLPIEVRKALGVGPGDSIDWIVRDGQIFLERAEDAPAATSPESGRTRSATRSRRAPRSEGQ